MNRLLGLALLVTALSTPAWGQCVQTNGFNPSYFSVVNVGIASGTPAHVRSGIEQGLNKWTDSYCNVGYNDFPVLDINGLSPKPTFGYISGLGPLTSADRHGHHLRYNSRYWLLGRAANRVPRQITDVFFVQY